MLTKQGLKKEFGQKWKEYYQVDLFKEKGFVRKLCSKCGRAFWTLDVERTFCGDSPCQNYEFIGKQVTNKKYDYIEMWKAFEKFFVENGHTSIPRYPVIDRWRQDLFFTIASIQDFQRLDNGNMTFVYPANPLIVPQVSLRFGDIQNVGVTGRHLTSFIMSGQHAFNYPKEKGSYFKDKCIDLNFSFLNKVLGIKKEELVYHEDFWSMPDFSEFGPSLETFSLGLELVNSVFTEFQSDNQKTFRPLDMKVIDVGWGHERLVWFSNGTEAAYDCLFGPVTEYMKRATGVKVDPKIFSKYSKLAGSLDIDEKINMEAARKKIADSVGITLKDLTTQLEPLTAIYAIADHIRTLLFAIADGGIPSNIGGGYNLRVILRRCLSFIKDHNLNIHLIDIAEKHAKYLKPMFPELQDALENMENILISEEEKYNKTVQEGRKIVVNMIKSGQIIEPDTLVKLYESHGITPETVKEFGKESKVEIKIPENFYALLSKEHILEKKVEKKVKLDLTGLSDTKVLFYQHPDKKEFEAKVIKILNSDDKKYIWLVLDETLFYPEGGGQEWDVGKINEKGVVDVQKFGHIVAHKVESLPVNVGDKIKGQIDWDRRTQLMHHHTAIHIINGAAKAVLGKHAWQAGTHKSVDKAHVDISHYKGLTEDEVKKIGDIANSVVQKNIKTKSNFINRIEAEKSFGLGIYQGGHIPEKELRILEIPGHDIEACAGTHVSNTGDISKIIIVGTEKIQDGVVRITIKAGKAAETYLKENLQCVRNIIKEIEKSNLIEFSKNYPEKISAETATEDLQKSAKVFSVPIDQVEANVNKFLLEVLENLKKVSKLNEVTKSKYKTKSLEDACEHLFNLWKYEKKEMEKLSLESVKFVVDELIKKVKGNKIFEKVSLDRKEMIVTGSDILNKKPDLTVVLVNHEGDIVCMSNREDASKVLKDLCQKYGGSGGGKPNFAQGKINVSKLDI